MKMRFAVLAVVVTALSVANDRFVMAADSESYRGDVTDVRVVRTREQHPGASLVWEPSIEVWKPKHLVVVYGAGIVGKIDMGDIYAAVSTNDGDAWQEPVPVFDHRRWNGTQQFAYANPVLCKPVGQDVMWCFAIRCPMNYAHSEDSQLVGAYSADGGRSWNPVELAMHYTGPLMTVSGGILCIEEAGKPRYLLSVSRNTKRNDPQGSRDQLVLSSTSLLEWRLAGFVPQPTTGNVLLGEGGLAPGNAPGELKIVMRTANYEKESQALDPARTYSSVSNDGGRTWTPAQQEPELWNSVSKPDFHRASDGTHIYSYNDGPAWSRMALRYKTKPAGGAWSEEKTFYESGTKNSYPTLLEVSPNHFYCVWDSGTKDRQRTNIRFGKLRLASSKPAS